MVGQRVLLRLHGMRAPVLLARQFHDISVLSRPNRLRLDTPIRCRAKGSHFFLANIMLDGSITPLAEEEIEGLGDPIDKDAPSRKLLD